MAQQNLVGVLGVQAGILLTELFRLRQQRLATLLLLLLIDLVGALGLRSFFRSGYDGDGRFLGHRNQRNLGDVAGSWNGMSLLQGKPPTTGGANLVS